MERALIPLVFVACVACGESEYTIRVAWTPPALADAAVLVEFVLVQSCPSNLDAAAPPSALAAGSFSRGGTTTGFTIPVAGEYGVWVRATSADCTAVAVGCETHNFSDDESATVSVTLSAVESGTPLCTPDMCRTGECVAPNDCQPMQDEVRALTAAEHSCALLNDALYCWGRNENGQLGVGDETDRAQAERVIGTQAWQSVSAGILHTCALDELSRIFCWGINSNGQLGRDGPSVSQPQAAAPSSASGRWVSVQAGTGFSCALNTDGELFCFGRNDDGQLGSGIDEPDGPEFRRVGGDHTWTAVAVADSHTCGINDAGELRCWGKNDRRQVFRNTEPTFFWPTKVQDPSGPWISVATGGNHSCGILQGPEKRTVYCWGANDEGQADPNSTDALVSPPRALFETTAELLLADAASTCVLEDTTLRCWGALKGTHEDIADAALGNKHLCAINTNGQVMCWGENARGQLGSGSVGGSAAAPQLACQYP